MSFVSVGGDGNNPTYFEVVAAEKLMPSLKSAIVYTMSVLSQRHPWVHNLLRFDDEVFAVATLCLEWHSLSESDACFAEALYGLTRKSIMNSSIGGNRKINSSNTGPQQDSTSTGLTLFKLSPRQRWATLLCQVLLPYIRAKADRLYKAHANQPRGILALALQYQGSSRTTGQDASSLSSTIPSAVTAQLFQTRMQAVALKMFLTVWPWVHAGCEGAAFAYNLAFLLDASPMHHPLLHLLKSRLVRVSTQDMMAAEHSKQTCRAALSLSALQLPFPLSVLRKVQLQMQQALTDNMGNGLLLAVFAFKGLEWWYTAAEDKLAASKALPLPPPPPPPRASSKGVGLPLDASLCPICRRTCTNPAQVCISGYVFCYPCVFAYILKDGCCPVTLLPATLEHVRKLYETA